MLPPLPFRSLTPAVTLLLACLALAVPARAQKLEPLNVGRTRVSWTPANGLSLSVDGVPVVRKSTLYIVKKGWSGILLDQSATPAKVELWKVDADGTQTATVTLENADAVCTYRFSAAHGKVNDDGRDFPRDTVTVDLAYRLKRDVPAEIEYGAGYLSGPVLMQRRSLGSYDINGEPRHTPESPVRLTPPAPGRTQEQNRLCPPFGAIHFSMSLGADEGNGYFGVKYEGDAPLPVIFDARSEDQAWAREFPVFWMGVGSPAVPVNFSDGVRHATFTFTSGNLDTGDVGRPNPRPRPVKASWSPRLAAFAPVRADAPLLIPRPKQVAFPKQKPWALTAGSRIVVADSGAATAKAARIFQRAVQEQAGLTLPIAKAGKPRDGDVIFGVWRKTALPQIKASVPPARREGYAVQFIPAPVAVGRDGAGVLWAAQTLVQLLTTENGKPALIPAQVQDWPSLSVRGVHLFHGKDALPFHEKLIDRVLTRFKMNTLVIQAEQVRWNADSDVAPSWAGTKDKIAREIVFARERGMTVYPLVQSYGHMEWLFTREKNRKFAEDPQTPYAVNFTNKDAVRYLEGFDTEADALFDAPAFHIGLDEVTMRGRFPFRSEGRTFVDLYTGAATHWRDFFTKRGKETWMWADMALHPSEVDPCFGTAPTAADAARVRAGLPKEIVMVDWQYGTQSDYPSLRVLKNAGFQKLIAATWFNPANIQNFSRAAAKEQILGALQTTWAGYESKEAVLGGPERKQFTAMVLAAEYFWNGGDGPAPDKLPYDPAEVFARQWRSPSPGENRPRAGRTAEWVSASTDAPYWMYQGPEVQPRDYPKGVTRLADGVEYWFNTSVWDLYSKLNNSPTSAVTLATKGKPGAVSLLLTATHRADLNRRIGTVIVRESGGKVREIPLVYGQNIAATDDTQGMSESPVAWRGQTQSGQPFLLRSLRVSATPGAAITGITVRADAPESAPALVALTSLDR